MRSTVLVVLLALCPRSRHTLQAPSKLIIDTDAGSDDAVGLMLALAQPSVEVVAITCVHGNTGVDNVTLNVLKTLQTVGRLDIPVYRGAPLSMDWTPPSDHYFGQDGFGDFPYPNAPDPLQYVKAGQAADMLVQLAREAAGEISLLCLGPLTNLALAARLDPAVLGNLKQVVVMGGSVEGVGNALPGVEYNFYVDAVSARVVFNATAHPLVLLPWESVVRRNTVPLAWRRDVLGALNSSAMAMLNQAERFQIQADTNTWNCADCLAAAVMLEPSLVLDSEQHFAQVAPVGDITQGAVFVDYLDSTGRAPNVQIIKTLDIEQYESFMLDSLK